MELMDEWESNTSRRICWGSAGRYWVVGQLQERGAFLAARGWCFSEKKRKGAFQRGGSMRARGGTSERGYSFS